MFTGIIEGMGTVSGIRPSGSGRRFRIDSDVLLKDARIGDSISVSGACLTAVTIEESRFEADVSPETLSRSTFSQAKIGDRVNLERAMRLSDRLDGHLVSGHVDGLGTIAGRQSAGNAIIVSIDVAPELSRYMIPKGSVAVDGISLTINSCSRTHFEVSIIPLTAKWTTIGDKGTGAAVNIETDMIGKYVERFLGMGSDAPRERESNITKELLIKSGFFT